MAGKPGLPHRASFGRVTRGGRQRKEAPRAYNALDEPHEPNDQQGVLHLEPGLHQYPFCLSLPGDLPSSFLGRHGLIRYYLLLSLMDEAHVVHKWLQPVAFVNPIAYPTGDTPWLVRHRFSTLQPSADLNIEGKAPANSTIDLSHPVSARSSARS